MRRRVALALVLWLGACAAQPPAPPEDGVVSGSVGVVVAREPAGVVVIAVREARGGLRIGDVVLRYNGEPIDTPRAFYRRVTDTRPGSVARIEVRREGATRVVEVPVHELDTTPRT